MKNQLAADAAQLAMQKESTKQGKLREAAAKADKERCAAALEEANAKLKVTQNKKEYYQARKSLYKHDLAEEEALANQDHNKQVHKVQVLTDELDMKQYAEEQALK